MTGLAQLRALGYGPARTASRDPEPMKTKFALVVLVVALVFVAYAGGYLDAIRNPERLAASLRDAGGWGYALYLLAFTCFEPMGIPAVAFIVPAGLIWPPSIALALSTVAAMGASAIGFAFARYFARDWVAARLPERLRRYDARLAEKGLSTVIVIRLLFFLLPPAHWVLGLSQVRFGSYLLGTLIGAMPGLILSTYVGGGLAQWLVRQPPWVWGVAFLVTVGVILWRRRRARAAERPGS